MSSRLASFNAPSTPNQSPVRPQQLTTASPRHNAHLHNNNNNTSSNHQLESPFHRRLRALLLDLATAAATWDDIVLHDGFRAAKSILDTRTQLEFVASASFNALAVQPTPRERVLSPKLCLLDVKAEDLAAALVKLKKQFNRLATAIDALDTLVTDAHKQKGWLWVAQAPLWNTWTLEKFALELPAVLPFYDRALHANVQRAHKMRDYSTSFEDARLVLAQWIAQEELQECPWADLDELFEVEIDRWASSTNK